MVSFANCPDHERLIVALDVADIKTAENLAKNLGDSVSFYKIGYQLLFAGGIEFAKELKQAGKKVFLDMKLLDIDHTIARAVENIVRLDFDMLTLHAYPKAMAAAVEAARGSSLCLLGVTVLTSMDAADLTDAGYHDTPQALVLKRAKQASDCKMGGIVASAQEAGSIRQVIGPDMALVTPGIRPSGFEAGDQKRIMTPAQAILAGASHLVVGRPVVASQYPQEVAIAIVEEISNATV